MKTINIEQPNKKDHRVMDFVRGVMRILALFRMMLCILIAGGYCMWVIHKPMFCVAIVVPAFMAWIALVLYMYLEED